MNPQVFSPQAKQAARLTAPCLRALMLLLLCRGLLARLPDWSTTPRRLVMRFPAQVVPEAERYAECFFVHPTTYFGPNFNENVKSCAGHHGNWDEMAAELTDCWVIATQVRSRHHHHRKAHTNTQKVHKETTHQNKRENAKCDTVVSEVASQCL